MSELWTHAGYLSSFVQDKIIGSIVGISIDGEWIVKKTFSIYTDPSDVTVVDGRTYSRRPPMWEEKMDEWVKEQEEFAKTFDSVTDYAIFMRTALALSE